MFAEMFGIAFVSEIKTLNLMNAVKLNSVAHSHRSFIASTPPQPPKMYMALCDATLEWPVASQG